jgi:hypothetical protein
MKNDDNSDEYELKVSLGYIATRITVVIRVVAVVR